MITTQEREYLRDIAKQIKEKSLDEKYTKLRQEWIDHNNLKGNRTLIYSITFVDVWLDIIKPSKILKVQDPMFRELEYQLLKRLYRADNFADDSILFPDIFVPIEYEFTDWVEGRVLPFSNIEEGQTRTAVAYQPVIEDESDIKKLRKPELKFLDWKKTDENFEMISDVFGDILPVQKGEPFGPHVNTEVFGWGLSMIDVYAELRGLENMYYDFYDEPDMFHEIMSFLQAGYMGYLDTLEKEHLLRSNNVAGYCINRKTGGEAFGIGENGIALTDQLPAAGSKDPKDITTKDLWGYFQAQELTTVSTEMRQEFCYRYQKPIAERFGKVAYGCCEQNDKAYDAIHETFPNLRVCSVPYDSNLEIAAANLKNEVMAWRPLAQPFSVYTEESYRKTVKREMEIMKDNIASFWCQAPLITEGKPEIYEEMLRICKEYSLEYAR